MSNFALVRPDGSIAAIVTNLSDAELSAVKLPDTLPDRYFRDSWSVSGGQVSVDMVKARVQWRRRMETSAQARFPWLEEAQKQELTAAVQAVDLNAAQTPEQLKQMWPEQLGPNNI